MLTSVQFVVVLYRMLYFIFQKKLKEKLHANNIRYINNSHSIDSKDNKDILKYVCLLPIDTETRLISILKSLLLLLKPLCIYYSKHQTYLQILFAIAYTFSITAALTITMTFDLKNKIKNKINYIKYKSFMLFHILLFIAIKLLSLGLILQAYFGSIDTNQTTFENGSSFIPICVAQGIVLIVGICLQNEINFWLNNDNNHNIYNVNVNVNVNDSNLMTGFTIWIPGMFWISILSLIATIAFGGINISTFVNVLLLIVINVSSLAINHSLK